jgi:putative FmdB family regulatory protein
VPIYEYACRKCRKQFEYLQRMSDPPRRKCEACGAQALERQISQTSFQLKGGGWYKDLYASPKPGSSTKSEGASDSSSSSDSGSSSSSEGGSASGSGSGSGSGSDSSAAAPAGSSAKEGAKPAKKAKKGSR